MKTQLVLCLGGTLLAGMSACKSEAPKKEVPMNVIYILADDLGYGDIGCYGQTKIHTPNIDKMAQEGMLFTQHYAGCTVSAPSRCSLMTGLHTGHSQIRGNKEIKPEGQQPMSADTYTLGKLMKSAGYTTGIFGKWGLGYPGSSSVPSTMGFDEFFGYNCQRQAHSYYPDHLWHNNDTVFLHENDKEGRKVYSQDLIHEQALKFIRDNKDKPFYAMLTYTLPHAELNLPHDSIYQQYENAFEEVPYDGKMGYHPSEKPYASFAAMVSRLDKYVGDVMAELKELGLDKNTIVIFTSDNGPTFNGGADSRWFDSAKPFSSDQGWGKASLREGGIRVPMIAAWPRQIKPGTVTDHISAFWDVLPTFADIIGVTVTDSDGISFLPVLQGKPQPEHDYLYWEYPESGGSKAIRVGDWKGYIPDIKKGNTQMSLYNLKDDPIEQHDIAAEHPDIVKQLEEKMLEAHIYPEVKSFAM